MTEKRPLFRPEAVEHHAKARTGGRPLDLRERRTTWLFRGLLAAVALAIGLAFAIPAETAAHGVAVVGPRGSDATLSGMDPRRIEPGQEVVLDLGPGTGDIAGSVESVGPQVRIALSRPAPPGARGDVTVKMGRTSVAHLLLGWDD